MTDWFEDWFGEEYLHLYAHRDDREAEAAVDLVTRAAPWRSGEWVLDLACGSGRHAARLAERGARVVGFDLSAALLRRAQQHVTVPLVRGDMRHLPFAGGTFGLVVSLFTSFGYFVEERHERRVLAEVARVLRPGGRFVLDFLNADRVRRTLVAHDERDLGRRRVAIERRISVDGRFIVKEIHLVDGGRSFLERVRLFTPDELSRLFGEAGLAPVARYGDYRGAPLDAEAERAIVVGQRP